MAGLEFRIIKVDEFSALQELLNYEETWWQPVPMLHAIRELDPEGMIGGWIDGKLVGCVMAWRFSGGYGYMTFFILHPDLRGKGYATPLWKAGVAHLAGLDYMASAFIRGTEAYEHWGLVAGVAHTRLRRGKAHPVPYSGVVALTDDRFDEMVAFDRAHWLGDRRGYWKWRLQVEGAAAFLVLVDGKVQGFSTIAVGGATLISCCVSTTISAPLEAACNLIAACISTVKEGDSFECLVPLIGNALKLLDWLDEGGFQLEEGLEETFMFSNPNNVPACLTDGTHYAFAVS